MDALEDRRDVLEERLEAQGDDAEDALYANVEDLDERIHLIQSNRQQIYSDEVKASCGVVVNIGWNGEPQSPTASCGKKMNGPLYRVRTRLAVTSRPAQWQQTIPQAASDDRQMPRFVSVEELFRGRHFDQEVVILGSVAKIPNDKEVRLAGRY